MPWRKKNACFFKKEYLEIMTDILLSTYNGANYLSEQIDSILYQTERDFRLLIRDDGSTDDTVERIDEYERRFSQRVCRLRDAMGNIGVIRSYERLLECSDADYILFSDQDDVWLPEKVELSLREIQKLEKMYGKGCPLLVHTDLQVVDEHLNLIDDSFWDYSAIDPYELDSNLKELGMSNSVTGCTMIINRALRKKTLPFPKVVTMHDAWLSIVAGKYGKVIPLGVATIKYRQHTGNAVGALRKETMSEKIRNLMSVIEANRKRYAMTKGIIYHSVFDYMYYKIKDMRRRAKL